MLLGLLALAALARPLPRYRLEPHVVSVHWATWIQVTGITSRGAVAVNAWHGYQYDPPPDNLPSSYPFLFNGKSVREIRCPSEMVASVGIDEKNRVILYDRDNCNNYIFSRGKLRKLRPPIKPSQTFASCAVSGSGAIFGKVYPRTGVQNVLRTVVFRGGKLIDVAAPAKLGFNLERRTGPLQVAGLPSIDFGYWTSSAGGIAVGYGVHRERVDDGVNANYFESALLKQGRIVPLKDLIAGSMTGVELDEGGCINKLGVIAATGRYRGKPAFFILRPT
jgi:hypothetical protein